MTSHGCTETPLSHFLLKIQKPIYIVQARSLLDGGSPRCTSVHEWVFQNLKMFFQQQICPFYGQCTQMEDDDSP